MKKFKFALLAAIAVLPLLQSCSKEVESSYLAYVTVNATATDDYSFTLDNGETIYPGKKNTVYNTRDAEGTSKNGNRAIIHFSYLDKEQTGYTYNVSLFNVSDILTKTVNTAQDTADATKQFGNDWIRTNWISLGSKWLDISYSINPIDTREGHRISLVNNIGAETPADMPEDYTYLEFRHKAETGISGKNFYYPGIVSYKLEDLHPSVTGKKGLYIAIIGSENDPIYLKVDYSVK